MKFVGFVGILAVTAFGLYLFLNNKSAQERKNLMNNSASTQIRYLAIGDSYTIGEGVSEGESYPVLLTKHLREEGIDIALVANPSVTGYTTQDAIVYELPVLDSSGANFVTILLGANDVLSRDDQRFQAEYRLLLDRTQEKLSDKDNIILLTIPDFSVTPYAKTFGYTQEEIREAISVYNAVIQKEAEVRRIKMVDLFSLSGSLENDPEMLVPDGLHPSGRQYALWEKELFPVAYEMLKEK